MCGQKIPSSRRSPTTEETKIIKENDKRAICMEKNTSIYSRVVWMLGNVPDVYLVRFLRPTGMCSFPTYKPGYPTLESLSANRDAFHHSGLPVPTTQDIPCHCKRQAGLALPSLARLPLLLPLRYRLHQSHSSRP